MGLFDQLKDQLASTIKAEANKAVKNATDKAVKGVTEGLNKAVGKGQSKSETFKFASLPTNVAELKALPEASLDSAYKTVALCMAVLMNYENNEEATWEMLDFLNGPEDVAQRDVQFYKDRLKGKQYKICSFFKGATPQNGYTPTQPYTITVSSNPYSFDEENWAMLYVQSSGADDQRGIKLRRKPSTNQWFINEVQCLGDIRIPTEQDKWA